MIVLGIETSCDECSFALVRDGREIISHVVVSQVDFHKPYDGVVPEIASRKHIELITPVFKRCMEQASLHDVSIADIGGIGVTTHPGLAGSLIVGLNYAKALAFALDVPLVGVNHIFAHLYAPQLEREIEYPYMGLLVSGGHTMITKVNDYNDIEVLGASIDDACGEAFDKVAKHYGMGYPGGKVIDDLAANGNPHAYNFPFSNLYKSAEKYDISYSGLKNAAINQTDKFWDGSSQRSIENLCASFQRVAIDSLLKKLEAAAEDCGIRRIVAGGGVAANSYLRRRLASRPEYRVYFPSMELCTDNGAMIAGIAHRHIENREIDDLNLSVSSRVRGFRRI